VGQQPNIELEISDLPRPRPKPAPSRRWRPDRPGDMASPDDVPWGGSFGTTGPDTGYVLRLLKSRQIALGAGEHRGNVDAAVLALAGARASALERSPISQDIDVALLVLGLAPDGIPAETIDALAAERAKRLPGLSHDAAQARALVAAVPVDRLRTTPDELRAATAAGEWRLGR